MANSIGFGPYLYTNNDYYHNTLQMAPMVPIMNPFPVANAYIADPNFLMQLLGPRYSPFGGYSPVTQQYGYSSYAQPNMYQDGYSSYAQPNMFQDGYSSYAQPNMYQVGYNPYAQPNTFGAAPIQPMNGQPMVTPGVYQGTTYGQPYAQAQPNTFAPVYGQAAYAQPVYAQQQTVQTVYAQQQAVQTVYTQQSQAIPQQGVASNNSMGGIMNLLMGIVSTFAMLIGGRNGQQYRQA